MSLKAFQKALKGWWMDSDTGDDYCRLCWGEHLNTFQSDPRFLQSVRKDARPTSQLALLRRSSGGWFAICECCGKIVTSPLTKGEMKMVAEYDAAREKRISRRYRRG